MFIRLIALILLIILSPLFLLISIFILFFSGMPIFFKQNRYGYSYKAFQIIKFRTMHLNSGSKITQKNDMRISSIGNILRTLKLDELPQLINIFKGDMYFVGPRPEIVELVNRYPKKFLYLNDLKPGVTDVCSVIFKNESQIISNIKANYYENEILPIKSKIIFLLHDKDAFLYKSLIFVLTILGIFNHKFSLLIISRFVLPYDEIELRRKLNKVLSTEIF
tara:strand:+ start:153 stop:815 length:663 start_codon:yes stop_codon:yes gene_type:complete